MLSVEQVKKILSEQKTSDKEAEEIRDGFYALAEIIFETWENTNPKNLDDK
jgi:hypothetical protein